MGKIVRNADEACKILKELMSTPQMTSIHFEFDMEVDRAPIVEYRIRRFAFAVEGKNENHA